MKQIIVIALILFCSVASFAQVQNQKAFGLTNNKALVNSIMKDIYDDVYSKKDQFTDLIDFGEYVLSMNEHGIYSIQFKHDAPVDEYGYLPYEFGLTVVRLNDRNPFVSGPQAFNYRFPLLGIKFSGYQISYENRGQYDILDAVKRHSKHLVEKQYLYMPFELSIKALKDKYQVGDPIQFEVFLTNKSKQNLMVKQLNSQTLKCQSNADEWNFKQDKVGKAKDVLINPKSTISQKFTGKSFSQPFNLEISCRYSKTYKGVSPSAYLKIPITSP